MRQGLYGIFEVFVDTILVCASTGLVVLVTGEWSNGLTGAALAAKAFETGLPGVWGDVVVTTGILTFAFSTLLGWSFYGETAIAYLLGTRVILPYRLLWLVAAYLGATGSLHLVWDVADTLNGLMALPNLVALLLLSPVVARSLRDFVGAGERPGLRRSVPLEGDAARLAGADVLEVHRLEADARDAVAVRDHLARLPGQDLAPVGDEHRHLHPGLVLHRADVLAG